MFDIVKLAGSFQKLFDLGNQSSSVDSCVNAYLGPGRNTIGNNQYIGRGEDGVLASFPGLIGVRSCGPGSFELISY